MEGATRRRRQINKAGRRTQKDKRSRGRRLQTKAARGSSSRRQQAQKGEMRKVAATRRAGSSTRVCCSKRGQRAAVTNLHCKCNSCNMQDAVQPRHRRCSCLPLATTPLANPATPLHLPLIHLLLLLLLSAAHRFGNLTKLSDRAARIKATR